MKLLEKDNYIFARHQKLLILATQMYKVSKDLSPPLMYNIFKLRSEETYNLRQCSKFFSSKVNSCIMELKVSHFWDQKFGIWYQTPSSSI